MSRPSRVLIVEDNEFDFSIFKDILLNTGIPVEVDGAADGQSALEYFSEPRQNGTSHLPRLILLDLNLPKISGMEVLRRIRENQVLKQIPVVILSSSRFPADVGAAYDAGATLYARKPNDLQELEELIGAIAKIWLKFATLPQPGTGALPSREIAV